MAYTPTNWVALVTALGPTNLNHLEGGLQQAAAVADAAIPNPSTKVDQDLLYYDSATSSWKAKKITDSAIAAGAGIAKSKLAALAIADSDVAVGAGINPAKIAAGLLGSQLQYSKSATPPGSPSDGDLWLLPADATNGVNWLFRYNAGSASASKWECIGGVPLFAEVDTSETTASATYAALATAGPSIALPRAGDYDVTIGCGLLNASAGAFNFMSYDIGGTGAVDADSISDQTASTSNWQQPMRTRRKTGLTAVTLTSKYKSPSATTATFQHRFMYVMPVRIQ
jgi:hypothetical protein